MKRLLFVLMIAATFALVSCGEKTENMTEEAETATQLAKGSESPVSICEGNVCTHEVTSSRECAVEGKCPGNQYAMAAEHVCTAECGTDCAFAKGGACSYAKERGAEGACQAHVTGKCTGKCDETCPHYKGMHTCTAECPADCPHAKGHVCTKDCAADCPHAGAVGGTSGDVKTTQAAGCGGCPLRAACKSGS